jgi:site-specific DNA recombinase
MTIRCAIYTRKSTDEGLDKEFNSLDAQREACEAYIQSQRGEGWRVVKKRYDDGGISGGTMERPALKALLLDIEAGRIDLVVVYKVDRLTRSLADFAKIIETFDERRISFVSVTQQFNTSNSMGRLTLNVLLSFAQFEREVTAERIRDKIAASKRKGMWMGGPVPLGYDLKDRKLLVNEREAKTVRRIFDLYIQHQSVRCVKEEMDQLGITTKRRIQNDGKQSGGKSFSRGNLYQLLSNPLYIGRIAHKGETYPGEHDGIVDLKSWDEAQSILQRNGPERGRDQNTKSSFLLTGLVFDEAGDPLYQAQTHKHGKRYGYYVSRSLMGGAKNNTDGWRLPVKALDSAVVTVLTQLLKNETEWITELNSDGVTIIDLKRAGHQAQQIFAKLSGGDYPNKKTLVRAIIKRVDIAVSKITLHINKRGLAESLGIAGQSSEEVLMIEVPISLLRRGVEMRLVIEGETLSYINPSLCRMVAKAHIWFAQLASGGASSVREIANREKVRDSEITRILRLAFLSPKIVENILDGKQPENVTTHKLRRLSSLPLAWDQQEITVVNID